MSQAKREKRVQINVSLPISMAERLQRRAKTVEGLTGPRRSRTWLCWLYIGFGLDNHEKCWDALQARARKASAERRERKEAAEAQQGAPTVEPYRAHNQVHAPSPPPVPLPAGPPKSGDRWTDAEIALLKEAFLRGGHADAAAALPHRTASAIKQRAIMHSLRAPAVIRPSAFAPLAITHTTDLIIAYRLWTLELFGNVVLLKSFQNPTLWPAGEPMKAHRLAHSNETGNGLYALKIPHDEAAYRKSYSATRKDIPVVFGSVALWGRVIEHMHGYRAEYAYPQSIFVPETLANASQIVRGLVNTYGCEARIYRAGMPLYAVGCREPEDYV